MRKLILSLSTIIIFYSTTVYAQTNGGFLNSQPTITTNPEFPEPGVEVEANFNNYTSGLNGAAITWFINNEELLSAENKPEATFIAEKSNVAQEIKIVVRKTNGLVETYTKKITPRYLDIIIEPQTRVPDFYQGRSLPSVGSIVNATALLDINNYNTQNYSYTWKVNNQVISGNYLRGAANISFETPRGDSFILSLEINDLQGNKIAKKTMSVVSVDPIVRFYEANPLFGLNRNALSSISLISDTVSIKAEPYYLDSRVYNNPAILEWVIDRQTFANDSGNPYEITMQRPDSNGLSKLDFHVRDTKQVLQGAESSLNINF